MERIIACCGLSCNECPAYLATINHDQAAKEKIAEQWSKAYGTELKADDIYCKNCLNTAGQLFSYCKICEIRKCAMDKGHVNCGHCEDYACDKLKKFFEQAPEAKVALDVIHEGNR